MEVVILILGVDCGVTGAYALLDTETDELVYARDLPTVEEQHGKKTRSNISAALFHDALVEGPKISYAIVELTSASPQMGVVSAFRMGQSLAVVTSVLQCSGIRTILVRPNIWKKAMGLTPDKEVSRARAIELWPDQSSLFARKLDHNRAESALLAEYGRRNP
jgi:hypothetical protein